jgi:hypothetical protein
MHEPSARFSLCCALPFLATKVSWEPHDRTEAYGRFSRQSSRQHDTTRFPPRVSRTNPPSHTLLEAWVSGRLFDQLSNPSTNADTKVLPEPAADGPRHSHVASCCYFERTFHRLAELVHLSEGSLSPY